MRLARRAAPFWYVGFPGIRTNLNFDYRDLLAVLRRKKKLTDPASQTATMNWLRQDSRGASLMSTATQLMALQSQVDAVLPEALRGACRVLRFQDNNLTLGVPAASHSAKLRQLAPRIVAGLEKQGWQVNGIAVRVQASLTRPVEALMAEHALPRQPAQPLGNQGIAAFEELQGHLREGPLANAVARLLARRKPG